MKNHVSRSTLPSYTNKKRQQLNLKLERGFGSLGLLYSATKFTISNYNFFTPTSFVECTTCVELFNPTMLQETYSARFSECVYNNLTTTTLVAEEV